MNQTASPSSTKINPPQATARQVWGKRLLADLGGRMLLMPKVASNLHYDMYTETIQKIDDLRGNAHRQRGIALGGAVGSCVGLSMVGTTSPASLALAICLAWSVVSLGKPFPAKRVETLSAAKVHHLMMARKWTLLRVDASSLVSDIAQSIRSTTQENNDDESGGARPDDHEAPESEYATILNELYQVNLSDRREDFKNLLELEASGAPICTRGSLDRAIENKDTQKWTRIMKDRIERDFDVDCANELVLPELRYCFLVDPKKFLPPPQANYT